MNPSPALSHAAFDFHTSLTFFTLDTCFNPIPKPSLVSWLQICLLNSIVVFETVRSYHKKSMQTGACADEGIYVALGSKVPRLCPAPRAVPRRASKMPYTPCEFKRSEVFTFRIRKVKS